MNTVLIGAFCFVSKAPSFESRDHYSKIHMEKELNEVSVCLGFLLVIFVSAKKVKETSFLGVRVILHSILSNNRI